MLRFSLCLAFVLPVAACASQPQSDRTALHTTVAQSSGIEAFANMAEDENVLVQCPRFMQSISAAETIVNEVPRDYPHML